MERQASIRSGATRSALCANYDLRTLAKPIYLFPSVAGRSVRWAFIISFSASARPPRCRLPCIHTCFDTPAGHDTRALQERPPDGRAAKQRDELAASHSSISSAATSNVCGIERPRALAVFRLTISSNLVGCRNGKSAGLSPLRNRLT
jgi:hypothetical protein